MKRKVKKDSERRRLRRAMSIRKRVEGSADKPRLTVFRSARHIYAQLIDDTANEGKGATLCSASTQTEELQEMLKGLKKSDKATKVGAKIAELAKAKGIAAVVFDRQGRPFHGRIAALAKGAREAGLQF